MVACAAPLFVTVIVKVTLSPSFGVLLSTTFVVTRSASKFTESIAVSVNPVSSLDAAVTVFVRDDTEIFASTVTLYSTVSVSPGLIVILSVLITIFTGAFALSVVILRVS